MGIFVEKAAKEMPGMGLKLVQDLLLDAEHACGVFHLCLGNGDTERLNVRRRCESGIDFGQGAEGANHEPRADQQNER